MVNIFLQDAFRSLTGKGYQALQSLLLEFCQWHPSEGLLNALLDMLVDGKFDIKASPIIKVSKFVHLYPLGFPYILYLCPHN